MIFIHERDSPDCNDKPCKCKVGYSGNDCNYCAQGFYLSSSVNGENTCKGNIFNC